MKIAWFTPFNVESAIGQYSKYAAESLSFYVDVDILTFQKQRLHPTSLNVVYFDQENVESILNQYDTCIFNMGDYADYHRQIFDVMRRHRGIVIAHDLCLHNFFRGYYLAQKNGLEQYIDDLDSLYGPKAREEILNAAKSVAAWSRLDLLKYSFSERIAKLASAVVVHSRFHRNFMAHFFHGALEVVPLLDMNDLQTAKSLSTGAYDSNGKIHLLTVGMVNPNKRVASVIEAVGDTPQLKKLIDYTVIGSLENTGYVNQLRELIKRYDLAKNVHLLGRVDAAKLSAYYQGADIVVNLRNPALEGASASLGEQMCLGKCVIVSNTGCYAEVPTSCVIKIGAENEIEELKNTLLKIVSQPQILRKYAGNAKRYAIKNFARNKYGKKLFDFLIKVQFQKPLEQLTEQLATEFRDMGITGDNPVCKVAAKEMDYLFSAAHSQN